ncbi:MULTISPECIES: YihY/virulence factor BrkB family protein [Salinibaculum]|uniref:YihY/virulence factor BrkB family protein n=1 Tax=Salinibaculum TaxID=2732368 RepID=UPI0030CDD342
MTQNARPADLARSLVGVVRDQQLSFLAAAIAYYAFVSVFPLTLVALAVTSAVAGQTFATEVVALASGLLTDQAASLLEDALTSSAGRSEATVVGLGVLLWSSLRVFRSLDIAFARVYEIDAPPSLRSQVQDALLVLVTIALALAATVVVGPRAEAAFRPLAGIVSVLVLLATLVAVFLPVYYVFPDCEMTVGEALPGAVFAAGGWVLLSTGFSVYAEQAPTFQLYGLIGGVLLALTWFYLGGLLLLLGAALNAVLAGRRDRQLQQEPLRDRRRPMSDSESSPEDGDGVTTIEPEPVDYGDLAELREELDRFEEEIEERTVHRDELESDLKQYVRRRLRRGKARGWGPYLVLLYGTAMTLGAFYFLDGVWAILAMIVVWLSTLGLYVLMLMVGVTLNVADVPGRLLDTLRNLR